MHEPVNHPSKKRERIWRGIFAPLLSLGIIVMAIWYLDSGKGIPFLDEGRNSGIEEDWSFIPLGSPDGPGTAGDAQAELNKPAPDFMLVDLTGTPVRLSDFAGKTVLINFWASWCVPCRQEMPALQVAFQEREHSGLVVLGVNLREPKPRAEEFASKYGVTFPILLDTSGEVAKAYRSAGLPESWIVGPDGMLRQRKIGAFTHAELTQIIDLALAGADGRSP